MEKQLVWQSDDGAGTESLSVKQSDDKIIATSKVRGSDTDLRTSWNATYSLICDSSWRIRNFVVDEHQTNKHLELFSDGNGGWVDENNNELKDIAGCIDIDFRATPFSNTLPIRRLKLSIGESATIDVAYINAPDLAVSRERQIYTRLSDTTWRFEQPTADFTATITVDDEGFVLDYPGLFHRR